MDRPLDTGTLRRTKTRKYLRIGLVAGALVLLFIAFSALLRPSVERASIRTAVVRRGGIEGTITTTGTTVPTFEQVISSPSDTRLLAVRKKPGSVVRKGESILTLDPSELNLSLERTGKELTLKENGKAQLRLDMERTLNDLDGQLNIKTLRLEYLHSKTLQGKKMMEIGAISKDQMEQTELEERIAAIEKDDLEQSILSTKLSLRNRLEGITAEAGALLKEKADIERRLKLLACEADREGVVTWIREEVGSSIQRGELVARIADLGSYRVEATLSDIHSSRLTPGMPAIVRLNDSTIAGSIETVYPNVENGVVRISVALEDGANRELRPNLRVNVSLVTSRRDDVLLLKKGPFLTGGDRHTLFVIRGGSATRVIVTSGVVGFDEVEITDGLSEGDEAIISDMSGYAADADIKIY